MKKFLMLFVGVLSILTLSAQTLEDNLAKLYKLYYPEVFEWAENSENYLEHKPYFSINSLLTKYSDTEGYDIVKYSSSDSIDIYRVDFLGVDCGNFSMGIDDGLEFILIKEKDIYKVFHHSLPDRYDIIMEILDMSIKYPDIITPEKFHKVVNEIIYPPYMFAPQRKASRKASIGNLELYFEDNKTKLLNDTIK